MAQLGQKDLERSLDFVYECHEAATSDELARIVIRRMGELVGCDSCSWNGIIGGPEDPHVYVFCEPQEILFPGGEELLAAHSHQHPLIAYYQRSLDGQALKISDFLSQRQFRHLGIYHDLYKRIEVEFQMACALPLAGQDYVGVALSRKLSDFSARDRDLLTLLRPHLAQAHAAARDREGQARLGAGAHRLAYHLSEREWEVLDLASTGATNAQVARALDISPRTVQKHLSVVYRKLDVDTRTAAAAVVRGWMESANPG